MIGSIQNTSLDNDPTSNGSGKPTLGAGMCSVVMGPDDWATPRDAIFAKLSASLFSSRGTLFHLNFTKLGHQLSGFSEVPLRVFNFS